MALGSCPHCGAPVSQKWRTCPSCGAELAAGKEVRETQEREEKEKQEREQREAEEQARKEQELKEKREAEEAAARAEAERLARMTPEERARIKAEEEALIRKKQKALLVRVFSIAAAVLLILGAFLAFRLTNRPVDERLQRADSFIATQNYPSAFAECEKIFKRQKPLNARQISKLTKDYHLLSNYKDKTISETAQKRYWDILSNVIEHESEYESSGDVLIAYNSQLPDPQTLENLEKDYPDDIVTLRLSKAQKLFDKGKLGDAKKICEKIYEDPSSLTFEHKCALASLYAAIAKSDEDPVTKSRCAWLYNQAVSFDEAKAKSVFEKNDAQYGTNIGELAKSVKAAVSAAGLSSSQFARSVVVTGVNVRLRRGPSLEAEIVTDFYGNNVHPNKGDYLEYVGEASDFYKVRYNGEEVWISKDYTSLVQ
ncbi:MAG: zinc-ribbon domain-containing protein [Bacteroidales bacterium]|nr:zinc-ribbon domain-containing protein [Bacteroidales bacterium]